ncbi:piggyBac transposable element-derived protein 1-like [Nilaparvata lugens]|uniref:piggyBac transposable element-derived protein 1-like n=1 Tax=Nilaparvata lugens TaxID=108931 RepID=UPI00193E1F13|nr:piggyBac transposable element-derived protein 1-like [Nilaparvata lugens]
MEHLTEEELYNILNGDSDNELLEDQASDDDADPNYELESENEEEQENNGIREVEQIANPGEYTWRPVGELNELTQLHFNPRADVVGVNPDILETMIDANPIDFLELFVTEDVINYLVIETNRYANQRLANTRLSAGARMNKWVNTTVKEMKLFLGMIIYMGILVLPTVAHYWRKSSIFTSVLPKYMSRNRFELLLSNFHCANNEEAPVPNNRLHKIQSLVDMLVENFQLVVNPGEDMCIDESIIPFRGRLVFRQYVKNKTHPYGIKIFKMCVKDCYTVSYKIYAGREATPNTDVATKVVLELVEQYLNMGRTLYVDNWYTSVRLADALLQKNTHLVGTLRKNRKFNPPNVVNKSLRRGEITAQKNNKNIVILKWKDRRDVLMLSTKHVDNMQTVEKRGREVTKPAAVFDYNKGKSFIDLSDQMGAYSGCLRRGVKWFRSRSE